MRTQLLYDWERNYVEPKAQSFLSREDCRELVRRAAWASGIPAPAVRFAKSSSMPCRAVPHRWEIVIADWGRNPVTLLHEAAHLATLEAVAAGEDPHGPSFLAKAIAFYSAFLGIDEDWLRKTAEAVGLRPRSSPRRVARKLSAASGGGFSEVEF